MNDLKRIILGSIAGGVTPLAPIVATALLNSANVTVSQIPVLLMVLFAILGSVTAYFWANKERRTLLATSVAAPFLIIGIIQGAKLKTETDKKLDALEVVSDLETTLRELPTTDLGPEALDSLTQPLPSI